ncbi:hypothetical protein [Salipiger sp. CCB-MM3]|uniref:hypothetical protein n=1 Tax=Salipiger sp. CCB-MM3 TaxID=1792508 RepID=UPI0012FCC79F|nr:hypothetical protein [Salipiger sp. CCB-MM3]
MERMRARVTRALALGLVAGLASACLPESRDEAADASEVSVRDLYPTVFKAVDFQSFSDVFGPELTELKKSDPGQYQAVIRGMARSIAFEPLSVSPEQMREKLPEATPFDDLPEAGSREFLKQFYDVSSDFLSEGGDDL